MPRDIAIPRGTGVALGRFKAPRKGLKGQGMLRLIFTICMIDTPDTCEQREMIVYDRMSATACVMGAMPELATWRQTHPNWRIARWRCENDRTAQRNRSLAERTPPAAGSAATAPGAVPVAISR